MNEKKLTVAVDFDGVIHQYISKWTVPEEIPDDACEGAIEWLRAIMQEFRVIIYTSRASTYDGKKAIGNWLLQQGMTSEELALIGIVEKPTAVIYLDDRAVQFCGSFPSIDAIRTFKPWKAIDPIAAPMADERTAMPSFEVPATLVPPTFKNS